MLINPFFMLQRTKSLAGVHEHASCYYNVFAPSGLTNQPQSYSLVELLNSTSILIFVLTEHRIILFINLAPADALLSATQKSWETF